MSMQSWKTEWQLSAAEIQLLEQTAALCDDSLNQSARDWRQQRGHCLDGLQAASKIGLLGLQVPESAGGLGFSFRSKAALAELLAMTDFGLSMAVINTHNAAARLCSDAAPALVQRYVPDLLSAKRIGCTALTEPQAGSDFGAIQTTATVQSDSRWLVNGRKAWISNAAAADLVILYAQTEPGSQGAGIAGFLVDGQRVGFTREQPHDVVDLHSMGAGGFTLTDYVAEPEDLILPPGEGFKSALTSINGARIYVAAMCCGMLQSALNQAAQYGRTRVSFERPLLGHQGWRWTLAEADAELAAARALVIQASHQLDAGAETRDIAAQAKVFATRMAGRHIGALMQAMGAEGLLTDYSFGRHLIGVQMAGLVDGSTQMLLERIGARYRRA